LHCTEQKNSNSKSNSTENFIKVLRENYFPILFEFEALPDVFPKKIKHFSQKPDRTSFWRRLEKIS